MYLNESQKEKFQTLGMIIRNQQRTTHSDSIKVSGRAKEVKDKGFYFLMYNPNGTLPSDVYGTSYLKIPKEGKYICTFSRRFHVESPILTTCPPNGIVLDPFCGTGTANSVASHLNRKSIGIDLSQEYIELAKKRISK